MTITTQDREEVNELIEAIEDAGWNVEKVTVRGGDRIAGNPASASLTVESMDGDRMIP